MRNQKKITSKRNQSKLARTVSSELKHLDLMAKNVEKLALLAIVVAGSEVLASFLV